jgi:hypothetical protein
MKFNFIKQKPILYCVVDNTNDYHSGWAKEIAINLSDFMIGRLVVRNYDVFIGKEEELLKEACDTDFYSHAVIIASGTSFKLSDRIFTAVEQKCKEDFFIAGHILDRGLDYYELHHQFYIVNLKEYQDLNRPSIGLEDTNAHVKVEPIRSETFLRNDKSIPEWIKKGCIEKVYDGKRHGWSIISTALDYNKVLVDLGDAIRDNKRYLYYEHDHVFLRMLPELQYNQFLCNNFVFPYNSDTISDLSNIAGPVEQYITVATGLNWIKNLCQLDFTENTTVIFTDINSHTLKYMENMILTWNGLDYVDFYHKHKPDIPNNFPYDISQYEPIWRKQWNDWMAMWDNWLETWNSITQLNFKFIHIDYTASYNLDFIKTDKNTVINLSDLFNHVPYVTTQSLKYRIACENRLLNNLNNQCPTATLILTGRAANGFFEEEPSVYIDAVSNFKKTDINNLKKTPWHITDWTSPRPLE